MLCVPCVWLLCHSQAQAEGSTLSVCFAAVVVVVVVNGFIDTYHTVKFTCLKYTVQ